MKPKSALLKDILEALQSEGSALTDVLEFRSEAGRPLKLEDITVTGQGLTVLVFKEDESRRFSALVREVDKPW